VEVAKSLNEVQRMQSVGKQEWVEEYVLSSHETMYTAYEQDRALLGKDQLYELRYEDLVSDPLGKLRGIYGQLDLGDFSRVEAPVKKHLSDVKNYRRNHYELPDEKREVIRQRWGGYFDRYGYDELVASSK